jgi:membrane protease YdiL (CAAX protease family)
MGIVLALLYEWTGSLGNTILLHSLNNAILTVLAFTALSS